MRAAFHDQLDEISDLLAEMAVAAGTAMNQATQALLNADLAVAEAVISGDDHLDELTSEVERRCYDAAALQQPVATDLRLVIGSLRISSSLERMGDLAVHVAKQARMRYPNSSIPTELRATFAELGALEDAIAAKTAIGHLHQGHQPRPGHRALRRRRSTDCTASCSRPSCPRRGPTGSRQPSTRRCCRATTSATPTTR